MSKPHHQVIALIACATVLMALLLHNFDRVTHWMRGPDAYRIPIETRAPDFVWTPAAGHPLHLLERPGRLGQVLLFVSSTCPCSNVYADRFIALYRKYQPLGFEFLWINEDRVRLLDRHPSEPLQVALARVEASGLHVDTVDDRHDHIAAAFGVQVTPEAIVVDRQGYLRYHGRVDDNQDAARVKSHELQDALDDLVAGRAVQVTEAKSIGCFIEPDPGP